MVVRISLAAARSTYMKAREVVILQKALPEHVLVGRLSAPNPVARKEALGTLLTREELTSDREGLLNSLIENRRNIMSDPDPEVGGMMTCLIERLEEEKLIGKLQSDDPGTRKSALKELVSREVIFCKDALMDVLIGLKHAPGGEDQEAISLRAKMISGLDDKRANRNP